MRYERYTFESHAARYRMPITAQKNENNMIPHGAGDGGSAAIVSRDVPHAGSQAYVTSVHHREVLRREEHRL